MDEVETEARVLLMLGKLPSQQAAAIRLHILQGMSYRDAAERLGIGHATVVRHERKGIDLLREMVAADGC
jgi:DNA-directed RNA polymerase specialized sigma24 family protein